jgi:D-alanine-D-alanine ligase
MDELRYDIPVLLLHNINPDWTSEEKQETEQEVAILVTALSELGHPMEVVAVEDDGLAERLSVFNPRDYVVFNWCEELPGVPHSEPVIAAVMEKMGFVFTGSSYAALALANDKPAIKRILDKAHITTPPWNVFNNTDVGNWNIYPSIVKPAHEHCSIGISPESIITSPVELKNRVDFILDTYKQPALVEEFIDGRELLNAVWGNGKISMLPPVEMDFSDLTDIRDRLFTYEAKYVPGSRLYESIGMCVPAELDPSAKAELERIVIATYQATGCRDYGRIDVRYLNGVFHVIDVNPNPDINPYTSMTHAAAEIGYSYGKMGSRIVNLAAARHPIFRR